MNASEKTSATTATDRSSANLGVFATRPSFHRQLSWASAEKALGTADEIPVIRTRAVNQLRERNVTVHYFHDLLTTALDAPGARQFLQERLTTANRFGPALHKPLETLVGETPAELLSSLLVWGVLKRDVMPLLRTPSLLLEYLDIDDFLLRPLPTRCSVMPSWTSSMATTPLLTSPRPSRAVTCW